jgi:hypothetical protein
MISNATKSPYWQAALQAAGLRWNSMKRSVLEVGLLAALCALPAASALASFSNITETPVGRGHTALLRQHLYQQCWNVQQFRVAGL